jgi:hypothetical protein
MAPGVRSGTLATVPPTTPSNRDADANSKRFDGPWIPPLLLRVNLVRLGAGAAFCASRGATSDYYSTLAEPTGPSLRYDE